MVTPSSPLANSLDNIKPLLEELLELTHVKKKIEARIKELNPQVRPSIEGRGSMLLGKYSFECKIGKGRKTLDTDRLSVYLADDGLNLEDFYKVGAPTSTMTVKLLGESLDG
jgi:hypothetical protein